MTSLIATPGANFDRDSTMTLLASVYRILIAKEEAPHSKRCMWLCGGTNLANCVCVVVCAGCCRLI